MPRVDAPIDAAVEAEAGIVFTPSHIPAGSFSLVAGPVSITAPTTVNTTDRTIDLNGGGAAVSADIAIVNNIAVWSVGAFTTTDKLIVTGDHPLLIVASKDVSIGGVVTAFAVLEKPGPGGSLPSAGTGKGSDGTKAGNDASGGGGAGHGTAGAVGGNKSGQTGGAAGPVANLSGAALVGGPGGGNGGGFTAAGNCAGRGARRSRRRSVPDLGARKDHHHRRGERHRRRRRRRRRRLQGQRNGLRVQRRRRWWRGRPRGPRVGGRDPDRSRHDHRSVGRRRW